MAWLLGRCLPAGVWRSFFFQVVLFLLGLSNLTISGATEDVCKDGKLQSPINIVPDRTKPAEFIPFNLIAYSILTHKDSHAINNDGSRVTIWPTETNLFINGGGLKSDYRLYSLHFHWGSDDDEGSEHTIDGVRFPMELQLVHFRANESNLYHARDKPDGLAILSFFFEISDTDNTDPFLLGVLKMVPYIAIKGVTYFMRSNPIRTLLPNNVATFYRYKGSLTVAPCPETVIWTVFPSTIPISEDQMMKFRLVVTDHDSNFRAVQPLNDRPVYRSFGDVLMGASRSGCSSAIRTSVLPPLLLTAVASLYSRAF